ncbi:O-antigen ligase family protein [Vibrio metschnikovii]|uniref:O-antigen ligase family protein n=1 Tax=Vibrio metschnikovii TaxID=28172 RepID=UPI001E4BB1B9|nr:O-antigen ligase family protein [Vibrio metschnikovii]
MKQDNFRSWLTQGIILLPYLYLFPFIALANNSDKKMVVLSIVSIVAILIHSKFQYLKENIKNPIFITVALMCIYVLGKYIFMSSSPSMLRVLLSVTLLMSIFPNQLISQNRLIWLSFISSLLLFINSSYHTFYLEHIRYTGDLNAIPYATICAVMAVIGFFFALKTAKIIPAITFLLATFCVVLSQTRGIWLALLCAMIIIIAYSIKNNKHWMRIGVTIILATVSISYMMKDTISQRIEQTRVEIERIESGDLASSIGLRLQMWQAATEIAKVNPWFGVGSDHKNILIALVEEGKLQESIGEFHPDHYHNQFFENLAKMGIIGLILTILLMLTPIIYAIRKNVANRELIISLSVLFFIACLTDVPFWYAETSLLYFLLIIPLCNKDFEL